MLVLNFFNVLWAPSENSILSHEVIFPPPVDKQLTMLPKPILRQHAPKFWTGTTRNNPWWPLDNWGLPGKWSQRIKISDESSQRVGFLSFPVTVCFLSGHTSLLTSHFEVSFHFDLHFKLLIIWLNTDLHPGWIINVNVWLLFTVLLWSYETLSVLPHGSWWHEGFFFGSENDLILFIFTLDFYCKDSVF